MSNRISVSKGHFQSRDQVFDEIEMNGLHLIEMEVPAVSNQAHWHTFSTWIYIVSGELTITDSQLERSFTARNGDRVDVPERVLHSEDSAGYTIIAGMSALPEPGSEIDLPPELLTD